MAAAIVLLGGVLVCGCNACGVSARVCFCMFRVSAALQPSCCLCACGAHQHHPRNSFGWPVVDVHLGAEWLQLCYSPTYLGVAHKRLLRSSSPSLLPSQTIQNNACVCGCVSVPSLHQTLEITILKKKKITTIDRLLLNTFKNQFFFTQFTHFVKNTMISHKN